MSKCVECGSTKNLLQHHVDYRRDITVPVCPVCHTKIHNDREHELYPTDGQDGTTSIHLISGTRDKLRGLKRGGENFNSVLERLLSRPKPFQIRFAPINGEGEPPRYEFVEVEDLNGASISLGEWEFEEDDEYALLVVGEEATDG